MKCCFYADIFIFYTMAGNRHISEGKKAHSLIMYFSQIENETEDDMEVEKWTQFMISACELYFTA